MKERGAKSTNLLFCLLETGNLPPWHNLPDAVKKLSFAELRKKINEKMKIVMKTFPKQMPVRALTKRPAFYKKTDFSKWSSNIFFIRGFRRPLTPNQDVGIRLITLSGKCKRNSNMNY